MNFRRKLIVAAGAFAVMAAAYAQGMNGNGFQNGTVFNPSISGQLQTIGFYFRTFTNGITGHLESGAGAGVVPALSSCGTGTLSAGSTDTAGEFTTTGATGCTLTFGAAYTTAPSCVVTEETINTAARTTTVAPASIIVAAGGSGSKYSYACVAKSGG